MSFLHETTNIDLSGKTPEELACIKKELDEQKTNISSERMNAKKIVCLCDRKIKDIDKDLAMILKETTRREDIEELKHIIGENIKNIEGFTLLSDDELSIITTKMDRTDYSNYGEYPRFLDLKRICKNVIDIKKRYPKWSLIDLVRGGQYDTLPPRIFYKYEYTDEYGCHFNI